MKSGNARILSHLKLTMFRFFAFSIILVFFSCSKEEEKIIKNYYSVGILSTEVLSYTNYQAVVKVRFFVLDKSNSDGLIRMDLNGKVLPMGNFYSGVIDSLKRITTPVNGNYSAAILMSNGLDETMNMTGIFDMMEPTVRKIVNTSLPANEVVLAKVGDKKKPVEILSNGFVTQPGEADQLIAGFFHEGNNEATDTMCLLTAIDSMLDYLGTKSRFENQHLFILMSRRHNYWQEMNLYSLMNKALQSNVKCHFLEFTQSYTWGVSPIRDFLEKLNAGTHGVYYNPPVGYYYDYEDGELPMDLLQISGRMPDMMYGGFECFEAVMTLDYDSPEFYHGMSFSYGMSIKLNTEFEQEILEVPFNFYID